MAEQQTPRILLGILVDVSKSMTEHIRNESGNTISRIEQIQESLDDLVIAARNWRNEQPANESDRVELFVFGFGFRNLISLLTGSSIPPVSNLLDPDPASHRTRRLSDLIDNWGEYRERIIKLRSHMLGTTPMVSAFRVAQDIFQNDRTSDCERVLLIISDGLPTDGPEDDRRESGMRLVREYGHALQKLGVTILTCFVTSTDITNYKRLYTTAEPTWSDGATLMFDIASELQDDSDFSEYLLEYEWDAPTHSKLFAQVNQSETLNEFLQMILAPLDRAVEVKLDQTTRTSNAVFVSYSHADAKYVSDDKFSLLSYIRGLEAEGFEFWWDKRINAGELWDSKITSEISKANIALVLVSQAFLNSKYCQDAEVTAFLEKRRTEGMSIVPILLSACDWQSHHWLSEIQMLPAEGKTIEDDYQRPGKRKQLYHLILKQLRALARRGNSLDERTN